MKLWADLNSLFAEQRVEGRKAEMRRVVEHCENWHRMNIQRGNHCWNCSFRNGYPFRAQPDKKCKAFKLKEKQK